MGDIASVISGMAVTISVFSMVVLGAVNRRLQKRLEKAEIENRELHRRVVQAESGIVIAEGELARAREITSAIMGVTSGPPVREPTSTVPHYATNVEIEVSTADGQKYTIYGDHPEQKEKHPPKMRRIIFRKE
jgi:hypothetical protein